MFGYYLCVSQIHIREQEVHKRKRSDCSFSKSEGDSHKGACRLNAYKHVDGACEHEHAVLVL